MRTQPARKILELSAVAALAFGLSYPTAANTVVDVTRPMVRTTNFPARVRLPYGGFRQMIVAVYLRLDNEKDRQWVCERFAKVDGAIRRFLHEQPLNYRFGRVDVDTTNRRLEKDLDRLAGRDIFHGVFVAAESRAKRDEATKTACIDVSPYPKIIMESLELEIRMERRRENAYRRR